MSGNYLIQDYPALMRYIDQLDGRIQKLRANLADLQGDLTHLKSKWQDHQFHEFARSVGNLQHDVEDHLEMLNRQSDALKAHARRVKAFNETRE